MAVPAHDRFPFAANATFGFAGDIHGWGWIVPCGTFSVGWVCEVIFA